MNKNRTDNTDLRVDLVCGDCREALKKMGTNSVHMVLTDPPYFIDGLDNKWLKGTPAPNRNVVGGLPVGQIFDPKQGFELYKFIKEVSLELARVLKPGGFFLSFSQPRLSHRMAVGIEDAGFEIRDMYAWHFTKRAQMKAFSQNHFVEKMDISVPQKRKMKSKMQNRKTPQLRPQFETIIMAQNPKSGTFVNNWMEHEVGLVDVSKTLDGKVPSTVMQVEKPEADERMHGHMTPKPLKLLSHLIEVFTLPGQTVLDPFTGSGSSLLAALQTQRASIGIEINKKYVEMAKVRLKSVDADRAIKTGEDGN